VVRGDVGFALRVEHGQAGIEDALAGLPGHRSQRLRRAVS
jgi:hypothetical protein